MRVKVKYTKILGDETEYVCRGKCIVLNAYVIKEGRFKIYELSFPLKKL